MVAGVVGWSWPRPSPGALLTRALSDLGAGRVEDAERALSQLARLREPTSIDRLARARVAEAEGDDERALEELGRVPDGDPPAATANLLAGRIEVRLGRLRPAERSFRAALAGDPTAAQPRRELAYLFALQHRPDDLDREFAALSDRNQLDDKTLVTWSRIRSANWDASGDLEALERAVTADPGDRPSRLALAEGLLRSNRPAEAERVLSPLPDSDPDATALRVSVALDRGDPSRAESLLAGGPDDHPALARFRGTMALARRDAPEAVRHFRIALKAEPNDRAALFGLGTALKMSGDPAGAEPYFEAARRHDRLCSLVERVVRKESLDDPHLRAELGEACESAGRLDEARAWYRSAIAHDPVDEVSQRALYRLDHRG